MLYHIFLLAANLLGVNNLEGTVTLESTGQPLHHATVVLPQLNRSTQTDESGKFQFTALPEGEYDILAHSAGLSDDRKKVLITKDNTAPVHFSLHVSPIRQEITVTASGIPTPDFFLTSGTLPAGITFDQATGVLSGTSNAATGAYPVTFTASNVAGTVEQMFTLNLVSSLAFTSAASTTFTLGQAGSFTVAANSTPLPNLVLTGTGTSLDGYSVAQILAAANNALGGAGFPSGYNAGGLNSLINNLNLSYDTSDCSETTWGITHLL